MHISSSPCLLHTLIILSCLVLTIQLRSSIGQLTTGLCKREETA
jgi:hypothetical protein